MSERKMEDIEGFGIMEFINKNIPWIITTLVAIGIWIGGMSYARNCVSELQNEVNRHRENINKIELAIVKLSRVEADIQEIKSDIKEIRNIVYKPNYPTVAVYKSDSKQQ